MWVRLGGRCHGWWGSKERCLLPSAIAQDREPMGTMGPTSWHISLTKAREVGMAGA